MNLIVENNKISNLDELLNSIPTCSDTNMLLSLCNDISNHTDVRHDVDKSEALFLLNIVRGQVMSLSSGQVNLNNPKTLALHPSKYSDRVTSSNSGKVTGLVISSILATAVMYGLIVYTFIIK